jgi:hypothetical protein
MKVIKLIKIISLLGLLGLLGFRAAHFISQFMRIITRAMIITVVRAFRVIRAIMVI